MINDNWQIIVKYILDSNNQFEIMFEVMFVVNRFNRLQFSRIDNLIIPKILFIYIQNIQ